MENITADTLGGKLDRKNVVKTRAKTFEKQRLIGPDMEIIFHNGCGFFQQRKVPCLLELLVLE